MTIDEMIAVLQAAKAGKQIQWRSGYSFQAELTWQNARLDMLLPSSWNFTGYEYRVKPEPREWWVNVYDGEPGGYIHTTKANAEYWQSQAGTRREVVHVREVIE